ncbi:collagen alpha-2(I) chain-like [Oryctolagus cuniculus]|uniref:collagen alpha-2(I) chain-like n=1 Tax=Oryctolagus cuniculus TaxID=9986 RepID=UPI003879B055
MGRPERRRRRRRRRPRLGRWDAESRWLRAPGRLWEVRVRCSSFLSPPSLPSPLSPPSPPPSALPGRGLPPSARRDGTGAAEAPRREEGPRSRRGPGRMARAGEGRRRGAEAADPGPGSTAERGPGGLSKGGWRAGSPGARGVPRAPARRGGFGEPGPGRARTGGWDVPLLFACFPRGSCAPPGSSPVGAETRVAPSGRGLGGPGRRNAGDSRAPVSPPRAPRRPALELIVHLASLWGAPSWQRRPSPVYPANPAAV